MVSDKRVSACCPQSQRAAQGGLGEHSGFAVQESMQVCGSVIWLLASGQVSWREAGREDAAYLPHS